MPRRCNNFLAPELFDSAFNFKIRRGKYCTSHEKSYVSIILPYRQIFMNGARHYTWHVSPVCQMACPVAVSDVRYLKVGWGWLVWPGGGVGWCGGRGSKPFVQGCIFYIFIFPKCYAIFSNQNFWTSE